MGKLSMCVLRILSDCLQSYSRMALSWNSGEEEVMVQAGDGPRRGLLLLALELRVN